MAQAQVGQGRARAAWAPPVVARNLPIVLVYGAVVALTAIATIFASGFLEPGNLANVARQAVPLSLVVIGQTFVLLTGGIDFR